MLFELNSNTLNNDIAIQLPIEFFSVKNMEPSWLLLTPMSLNPNRPTLETKETKTQRELYIVSDEMKNTLEHFGKNNRTTKRRQLQQN